MKKGEIIKIWDGPAPGAHGDKPVDTPSLTYFPPNEEMSAPLSGMAMLVLPGGGYGHLATHEGAGYAEWLASNGMASFVPQYRLATDKYQHPAMLHDAARACRLLRKLAPKLGYRPNKIGVIGSSAGGHLAATLLTSPDGGASEADDLAQSVSSLPNFGVLCYPVITFSEPFGHRGSCNNLLGQNPCPELITEWSAELRVTEKTPPCFLWHTFEDPGVPVENSMMFASALRRAGVHFELHVYEKGGHGLGLANGHPWAAECVRWLAEQR